MKKAPFFIIIFLLSSVSLMAQSSRLRAANAQFENFSYVNAIRLYEECLRVDKAKTPAERRETLTKLAYSYRKVQDSRNAERVYADLITEFAESVESENFLYYAQSLASNGKHRESQKMYSRYGEMQAADLRGRKFTVAYMDPSRFYQDSSQYRVEYLYPINSRQADFSPMYYKSGIVFVSARNEAGGIKRVFEWNQTPFLDLYMHPDTAQLRNETARKIIDQAGLAGGAFGEAKEAEKNDDNKKLSKSEVFSKTLNSKYHEGPLTFFKDYSKVVFTRNNYLKGRSRESSDGINKLKLYVADAKGNAWASPKELPFNSDEYSCGHPAISPDNTKLYFVSDMPGGFGGTDVYVVDYNGTTWGTPVNLGKEVNTEGNEMFPFVDDNGDLYFASDGHEGIGGLDIFYVGMKEAIPVGEVQNLGAPINSEKDDFGLITNTTRTSGYFSSSRRRGYSDDNIYYFERACRQLSFIVYGEKNKPLEGADVRVVKNGTNGELAVSDKDGRVKLCLESGSEYEFKVLKEGYATNSVKYATLSQTTSQKTDISIYLEKSSSPIVRGTVLSEANKRPISGANVYLENEKTGAVQSAVTGRDGGYEFEAEPNANYTVRASKTEGSNTNSNTYASTDGGYTNSNGTYTDANGSIRIGNGTGISRSKRYATSKANVGKVRSNKKGPKVIQSNIGMVAEGDVFVLDNIYYDVNQFFIRPDAATELDSKLLPLLEKYPQMKVEIHSHTDSRASDTYNLRLSENRARAVVDYLIARGINPNRLASRGYGENELVNGCDDTTRCNEEEHQKNRRTEFKIISI